MPSHKSILERIDLKFGPVATIGRYVLAAEKIMRGHGIALRVTTLDEIVHVNQKNRETWASFLPIFDPRYHGDGKPELAIVGENTSGDVVATMAARLYDWSGTNFSQETQALRLMYAEPEKDALAGESWRVTALAGKGIEGQVAYSGAAWYHPTVRGIGLFEILPRVSRSLAHSLWHSDCTISISSKTLIDKRVTHRVGYSNLEMSVEARNSRIGTMSLGLVWSKTEEMLADIEDRLAMLEATTDQANATSNVSTPRAS
jgi:hypothetical protein